jgi:hypothetical protein
LLTCLSTRNRVASTMVAMAEVFPMPSEFANRITKHTSHYRWQHSNNRAIGGA